MKKLLATLTILTTLSFATEPLIVKRIYKGSDYKFLEMKTKIAQKMGINFTTSMGSCIKTSERDRIISAEQKQNLKSIEYYNNKFGKDWEKKLDKKTNQNLNR